MAESSDEMRVDEKARWRVDVKVEQRVDEKVVKWVVMRVQD